MGASSQRDEHQEFWSRVSEIESRKTHKNEGPEAPSKVEWIGL